MCAPDPDAGWGMQGYHLRRTVCPTTAGARSAAASKGKDPTLLGVGYKSRAVIGKHPTGVLLIDDIHDENNTRSARELEMVRQVFTGTILPTITAETWQVVVGTPWVGDDILDAVYWMLYAGAPHLMKPVGGSKKKNPFVELRRS